MDFSGYMDFTVFDDTFYLFVFFQVVWPKNTQF